MDAAALGLAVLPPTLAILVEYFNPISDKALGESAERDLAEFELGDNHKHVVDNVTMLAAGAVEVSGLAPTIVASVTSGFAVIHELPWPFWATVIYILIYVGIVLFVLRLLAGHSFFEIQERKIEIRALGKTLKLTRSGVVRRIIYTANATLIAASVLVYLYLNLPCWLSE